jgi:hypothetical protein
MLFFSEVRAQSSSHGRSITVGDTSNQKNETNSNWMNMRGSPALFSIDERRCDRRRKKHASLPIVLGTLAVAVLPSIVVAEETICRGRLWYVTVDNLRVPAGGTCTLQGGHVKGSVKVEAKATLHAYEVRVTGNVQAENARLVLIIRSPRIGGSVQVKQGGSGMLLHSTVEGDVQYEANNQKLLVINIDDPGVPFIFRNSLRTNFNNVKGNVQVIGNQASVQIYCNVIGGNLQCKENKPPLAGRDNQVGGTKEDQCSAF